MSCRKVLGNLIVERRHRWIVATVAIMGIEVVLPQ